MGLKRRSRELALQMLFQMDMGTVKLIDLEQNFLPQASAPEAAKLMALKITRETWDKLADIDGHLRGLSANWDLTRMAAIDRNILRLATYEIVYDSEVPKSVAINEAIEIVKRYSTDDSSKFVNGILDKLEKKV
ncbi:MAG TPA: transcription antitermination factor NusB [bacterium]|jgi:N utilization substance protein B|nr:transcription antitermination factor NusB [bacterium]